MSILRACILIVAAIVFSGLSLPNLFPNITAPLVDEATSYVDRTGAATQFAVGDAETLISADNAKPTLTEMDVSKPVDQSQAVTRESQPSILLRQFQSWAAAQLDDAAPLRAIHDEPAKAVQDAPKRTEEDARQPLPRVQKRREARPAIHQQEATTRSPQRSPQPVRSAQAQILPSLSAESLSTPRSR
jgi:hypothetical protein